MGEIRMFGFNYCPEGWAAADGQVLRIAEFNSLFSLLGTTYGEMGGRRSLCLICAAVLPSIEGKGRGCRTTSRAREVALK